MKQCLSLVLFLVLLFPAGCSPESWWSKKNDAADSRYADIVIPGNGRSCRDTALFLGALPGISGEWKDLTETHEYGVYRTSVVKSWDTFFQPNLNRIRDWSGKMLPSDYEKTVFYPFSGPDVLNPLAFYPEARDIIMFGLEPTGGIPGLASMPRNTIIHGLKSLLPAINFMLDHAFFITAEMEKSVGKTPLSGTTAIMVFFLARDGYRVMDMRPVYLDAEGMLRAGDVRDGPGAVRGVEIIFTAGDTTLPKRVRYFQVNVADGASQLEGFLKWLEGRRPFTTIIKSASYLMHNENFSAIRNAILSNSTSILQDDTGIPYRSLKQGKEWDLRLFGKYHRPLPVFKERYQPELERDLSLVSGEPLPFVYGYGYGYADMTYHLLLARRAQPGSEGDMRR